MFTLLLMALGPALAASSLPVPSTTRPAAARSAQPPSANSLIIRGFDPVSSIDAANKVRALERAIPQIKALAPAAVQSRVLWSIVESREGSFDWSACDATVAALRQSGLRWSPILVIGGIDGPPRWLREKQGYRPLTCVEHGKESQIASRWFPPLRTAASRFIKVFGERYRGMETLESIVLGVAGADGRASFPESAGLSTTHLHSGLWIKDDYAVEAFQIWLASKYGGSTPLRDTWGGLTRGIPYVQPFLRSDAPTERAWIDQLDFLTDSIVQWSRFCLKEARSALPKLPIYLRTSAYSDPESGVDLASQARTAADLGAGLQAVFDTSDYRTSLLRTAVASSAAGQFNVPMRLEAQGSLPPVAASAAVFAGISNDGGVCFDFAFLSRPGFSAALMKMLASSSNHPRSKQEIAVYYPESAARLTGLDALAAIQPLRDRFDFDVIGDKQIELGALSRYKALVMVQGNVAESGTLHNLFQWTRQGGVLIHPAEMGRLLTIDRDETYRTLIFGSGSGTGTSRVIALPFKGNSVEYRARVVKALAEAPELSPATRAALAVDAEEDGIYVTVRGGKRYWLNLTAMETRKSGTALPPYEVTAGTTTPTSR